MGAATHNNSTLFTLAVPENKFRTECEIFSGQYPNSKTISFYDTDETIYGILILNEGKIKDVAAALMDLIEGAVGFVSIDLAKERVETVYGVLINFN